jgi:hypothetical protein
VEALSEEAPTSQASLQSREQATTLIWKGDFAGAYGAVQYLESDAYERDWVTRVEQANRYFLGLLGADEDLPTYIQALLNKPRCLLVAMRVEAALWAGRLPEAITWSWSFAEAALLDFIEQLPYVDKLDELNRTLMCRPGHTPPSDLTSDKGWCLKSQLGTQSVYTVMTQGREQKWYRAIERETNIGELRCYRDAMRGSGPLSAISPYILRNVCAHSVLDQQTMATAEGLFVTANIWSGQPQGRIGHYFLECHLTKSILRKLGVADPSKCYLELVQGLTTDLAQYEL